MNPRQLYLFAVVVIVSHCCWVAVAQDKVTREIYLEKGSVWVEDKLHASQNFAQRHAELSRLFRELQCAVGSRLFIMHLTSGNGGV